MDVRAATEDEIDRLARIWHDGWREAHEHLLPEELARLRTFERLRDRLRAMLPAVRVVGAPGAPTGFCMVRDDELHQLYVSMQARGTGAALALVDDAEARLRAAHIEIAWLACAIGNDRAARFYEKCGWHRVGNTIEQVPVPDGTLPLEVWRYEKRLREHATPNAARSNR
ncbi:MAG: GNAT family N-acetyltransferase [Gemmatimonadaceae bacterium]